MVIASYLFQKLHVLTAHARLTELQESVGSRRVVQDDLENFGAEEIGQPISVLPRGPDMFWTREGCGRRIVLSRQLIPITRRAIRFCELKVLAIGASPALRGHLLCHQRHD